MSDETIVTLAHYGLMALLAYIVVVVYLLLHGEEL